MATIKKTLSSKTANGTAQVLYYVVNGRNGRMRIKSGIYVPVQLWNDKKETLSIPKSMCGNLLYEMRAIKDNLENKEKQIFKLLELYGNETNKIFVEKTLSLLKDYSGLLTTTIVEDAWKKNEEEERKAQNKDIYDLAQEYLNSKTYSKESVNHFRVVFRSMARFEFYCKNIIRSPFAWDIDTISEKDIERYFSYIENEHTIYAKHSKKYANMEKIYNDFFMPKKQDRDFEQRGANSIVKFKKKVKTFWAWLIKKGYTQNNPLLNISPGVEKYGTPFYLTIEERNQIASHDFSSNKHLRVQRDIFIFHCLIGCRVGDLLKLTKDNIVNDILIYTPHKTKDESQSFTARVPLIDEAKRILAEYKGKDKHGRILPFISEQKYNDAIKEVLTECGITRNVNVRNPKTGENEMKPLNEIASSHMARRTFVGNIYKGVKDPNIVGKMSGHVEGSRAFNRYRNIDDDILTEAINTLK